MLNELFGDDIRSSDDFAINLWSSLANVTWIDQEYHTIQYSFRAAGDAVAAIRGDGDYMDWYCSGPDAVVDATIANALSQNGWSYEL